MAASSPHDEGTIDSPPSGDPPRPDEFGLLYDEHELALIEQQRVALGFDPEGSDGEGDIGADDLLLAGDDDGPSLGLTAGGLVRRYGMIGALGARSMLGLAEVIEPEKAKRTVIEFAPDRLNEEEQLVTFHFVAGDPRASRLVIRPWLRRRRQPSGNAPIPS